MTEVNEFISGDPRSFGNFGDDMERVQLEDVYGAKLIVHGFKIKDSEFSDGEYVIVDVEMEDGSHAMLRTGGRAVKDQLEKNAENLPFKASMVERISKKNGKPYPSFTTVAS